MARTWLGHTIKQGIKLSLIARNKIGQAGHRLTDGWQDLINEARAEREADRTRQAAETAEAASIQTASERLKSAAQEGERARSTAGNGIVTEPEGRPRRAASKHEPVDDRAEAPTVDMASAQLEKAARARKHKYKRDDHEGLIVAPGTDVTEPAAPPDVPATTS